MSKSTQTYTLIYDESNNYRSLSVDIGTLKLNKDWDQNYFLLGGIAHSNDVNIEHLNKKFEIFKNEIDKKITELKFNNIASNDFLSTLKSKKLTSYINFLKNNSLYIHIHFFDQLFLYCLDLCEDCAETYQTYEPNDYENFKKTGIQGFEFKSITYELVKQYHKEFFTLFIDFNFPQVNRNKAQKFILYICALLNNIKKKETNIQRQKKIQSMIKTYKDHLYKNFGFLDDYGYNIKPENVQKKQNNTRYLIKTFVSDYYAKIQYFPDSNHIFDEEGKIKENLLLLSKENKISIKFKNSKDDFRIQLSDIIVGFFNKLTEFCYDNEKDNIINKLKELNQQQKENLIKFVDLWNESVEEQPAFLIVSSPEHIRDRFSLIYNYVARNDYNSTKTPL